MEKFRFKKELYNDLKEANKVIRILEQRIADKEENLEGKRKTNDYFKDNLENVYYTLKTIKELTKDQTIKTICILKMQDIKNMSDIYIGDE